MRRRGKKDLSQKFNNILFFLAGMLAVVVIGITVIGVQTKANSSRVAYMNVGNSNPNLEQVGNDTAMFEEEDNIRTQDTVSSLENESETVEKWQEGIIEYKGRNYLYNSDLKIILLMGVDKDGPAEAVEKMDQGGQSDAMFLLIANEAEQELSVFSIHRNSITDIDMYDSNGKFVATLPAQICLQHAFGDGRKLSCSRSVEAVSKMFRNLPIYGYVALNMGGVPAVNDSIGGVELEVLQDLKYPERGVKLKKGDVVRLNGQEAYCYLRGRDVNEYDSATLRLRREEQYIIQFMKQLKESAGGNSGKAEDVYCAIEDYLVTNLNFTDVVETLMGYDFQEERMYTVPGETTQGEIYEEFHIDEEAFYDLMIQVFYKEV